MNTDYQTRFSSFNYYSIPLSRGVKFLLASTFLLFVVQVLFNQAAFFIRFFALTPASVVQEGMIWQLATYLFIHGSWMHLLLNALGLYFFATDVEREMGTRNFFLLYFFCGVGAGLCALLMSPLSAIPTLGASGAIFGILMAYSLLFPNRIVTLFLFFILPVQMRARNIALFFGLTELFFLMNEGGQGNISRIAHLGGLLFGYLYLRYEIYILDWVTTVEGWILRHEGEGRTGDAEKTSYISRRIDPILDKISKHGLQSLTRRERKILLRAKKKYFSEKV